MKSCSRNFNHEGLSDRNQEWAQISLKYLVFDYKIFFEKKYSIFNNSCTISLNTTKPPPYTDTYQGLSNNNTMSTRGGAMVWDLLM
jgi:hypothetical protein